MLKGKVAIVTGGSKGIGNGIAAAMLKEGMKVAITSRSQRAANETAKALGESDQIIGIESDVRNYESQQNAVAKVIKKMGETRCHGCECRSWAFCGHRRYDGRTMAGSN